MEHLKKKYQVFPVGNDRTTGKMFRTASPCPDGDLKLEPPD
jgi:hypothetical protein